MTEDQQVAWIAVAVIIAVPVFVLVVVLSIPWLTAFSNRSSCAADRFGYLHNGASLQERLRPISRRIDAMSDPQQTGFPWRARIGRVRDHLRKVAQFGVPPRIDLIDNWADELGQIIDNAAEADALPSPTCATCRFWEPLPPDYQAPEVWGYCTRGNHTSGLLFHVDGGLETQASFGCLQHETRQPQEGQ